MLEDRSSLVSRGYPRTCERENSWGCMNCRLENGKRPLDINGEEEVGVRKSSKQSDARGIVNSTILLRDQSGNQLRDGDNSDSLIDGIGQENSISSLMKSRGRVSSSPADQSGNQRQAGDNSDSDSLVHGIGRDNSISCLIRCSRADYGSIASLNRSFRSLVRSGELYRLRRQNGMIEHWVYISCDLLEWEAFDPNRQRWMRLPMMHSNDCFVFSDKESLAVGTELLVFGKEVMSNVIYKYSLLTNTWSSGMRMNAPRCLFGSASLGEIAIIAGGCNSQGMWTPAYLYRWN